MSEKLNCSIIDQRTVVESILYPLNAEKAYILSDPNSCKLLCGPEIIGYQIPQLLLRPVANALAYFAARNIVNDVNIVNILRGGLNFPIEAACDYSGIRVKGVSFLTSERVFLENRVSRIESKYRKINSINNATIIIGDIIASGETLNNAVRYIEEQYILTGEALRNIIVFTIGTRNTLKTITKLNCILKERWKQFEGIWAVFIEGIFTTYPNNGITGLNLPYVDFFINGGLLSPEYRCSLMGNPHIIFEKCSIYDGGARRFEQNDHISCLLNYWSSLADKADDIKIVDFLEEKYGYSYLISFDEWKKVNHYTFLDVNKSKTLYQREQEFFKEASQMSLYKVAQLRLAELKSYYSDFL